MKKRYTREKKTLCGEGYMEVDLYHITPEEHAAKRRKKTRPSSERQKKRNAQHAHRWRVQKANANFTVLGFYLTLTYIDTFLPESMEQAQRDLRNYIRRVKAAIAKLYGADVELRVMGLTGCGRKSGRYHHHLLGECKGLTMRQNAEFRQLLEDKWAVRWPDGSVESLGTANADRLNLQNRLDDLITYFEKHTAGGAHPQRHPMEPQAAAQRLHRLQGQRLLVGAEIPGLEVCAVRRAGAGRAGRRKRGMGRRRAALLCGDGKAGGCESSHLTDKVPVFCVLTRAEERRRGIDQRAETTGTGRAAGLWTGKKRLGGRDRAGDGLLRDRRPGMQAAFTAAVSGRDAGGASGGEAAHRADDLLPQGAGSAEHRCGVCSGGGAVIALP